MVGLNFRPAVAELLCNRSLANVPHCDHTSRLKWNLDPADPTEHRNLENCNRNSGPKEIVALV